MCLWAMVAVAAFGQSSIRVRGENGQVVKMAAEDYVAAVVAGEAGVLTSGEARKAVAVAARTYALRMRGRHRSEGFDFCVTTHCQRALLGEKDGAARATAGEVLWRQGHAAMTEYSRDCGGRSESTLREDPYCQRRAAGWHWRMDYEGVADALAAERLRCPKPLTELQVIERSASGRAKTVRLSGPRGSEMISASTLRFAVGRRLGWNLLRSDLYRVEGDLLIGRGQGHGVGLCQLGAEEMGKQGFDYRAILQFYYPGTTLSRAASGFEWTRLGGERVTVLTVTPNRDRGATAQAEQALHWAEARLHQHVDGAVEIRLYPDVAAFRDATGEPGWVAARTRGLRVDVQPKAELIPTLRHEMLHVVVEQHAAAGLPVWFREGLVEVMGRSNAGGTASGDVQSRVNEKQARDGYADAAERVRALMQRYGETAVLSWMERGLPREVKYSSSSKPTVNSK